MTNSTSATHTNSASRSSASSPTSSRTGSPTSSRTGSPSAGHSAGRRCSALCAALDREWAQLRSSRRALRTARSWVGELSDGHPLAAVLVDLHDLDELLAVTQRGSAARRLDDEHLLALVTLARTDELAGRVVLQHLLPGLIDRSQRYRSFHEQSDPLEVAVPVAWMAIRTFDVDRRRRHVAASLLSDSVFQAFRRPLRRMSSDERVRPPSTFVSTTCSDDPQTALDEFVLVLREATTAGVAGTDIDLLRQLVRVGSPGAVAREQGITPRALRNRRDRAIDHVRAAVAVAA